jgi:uncharacterized protein (DUF983 family)
MKVDLTSALLHAKCPQCRKGDMFTYPFRVVSKFMVMNKTCPYCQVMLEPEPGFYQGAMYVGYGLTVVVTAAVGLFLYAIGVASAWTPVILVIVIMIGLAPLNYRYSRVLYLYMFGGIKYTPEIK